MSPIVLPPAPGAAIAAMADIIDACATWLGDEMSVPVYYPILPGSVEDSWQDEAQQALVVSDGGEVPSAGSRSYVQVQRPRADLYCYGPTVKAAKDVYLEAAYLLKNLKRQTVQIGPVGSETVVHLDNALHSTGPIVIPDPDAKWCRVFGSWAVHGSEIATAI